MKRVDIGYTTTITLPLEAATDTVALAMEAMFIGFAGSYSLTYGYSCEAGRAPYANVQYSVFGLNQPHLENVVTWILANTEEESVSVVLPDGMAVTYEADRSPPIGDLTYRGSELPDNLMEQIYGIGCDDGPLTERDLPWLATLLNMKSPYEA